MITVEQCRAARAILGVTQQQLADEASVNKRTIMDFESGNRTPIPSTLSVLETALSAMGVEFIPENGGGAGVRLRKRKQQES